MRIKCGCVSVSVSELGMSDNLSVSVRIACGCVSVKYK